MSVFGVSITDADEITSSSEEVVDSRPCPIPLPRPAALPLAQQPVPDLGEYDEESDESEYEDGETSTTLLPPAAEPADAPWEHAQLVEIFAVPLQVSPWECEQPPRP
jgi:hypothetical protein